MQLGSHPSLESLHALPAHQPHLANSHAHRFALSFRLLLSFRCLLLCVRVSSSEENGLSFPPLTPPPRILLLLLLTDAQLQEIFCVYVVRETAEAPCAHTSLRPERPELLDARDARGESRGFS